ncbi:response regulator transcription factor [Lachnospiraceae bacterium 62-35]
MKYSIVIIEERELFRKGICRLLASLSWISVLYETGDVDEGLEILSQYHPSLLLIDPFTNKRNYPDILKIVRKVSSDTHIVIVTDCDSPDDLNFAAKNGVRGYFLKSSSFTEFEHGLFQAAMGQYSVSPSLAPILFGLLSCRKPVETLTAREAVIYDLMAQGRTNQEIADQLHISLFTVKNHVSNIIKKLNLKNRYQSMRNSD